MADATLQIVAQIRDLASEHLRRIGEQGQRAGKQVAAGMAAAGGATRQAAAAASTASAGMQQTTAATAEASGGLLKMGKEFQGLRKLAGGAMAGIGAGIAAASAQSETMGQAMVRVGMSLAAGFAAGGPVGLALAGAGVLIGRVVGQSQEAEKQALEVAKANEEWTRSVRELTAAYKDQADAAEVAMRARAAGLDPKAALAARAAEQQRLGLVEGINDAEGRQAGLLQRTYEVSAARLKVEQTIRDVISEASAMTALSRAMVFGDAQAPEMAQAALDRGDVEAAAQALSQAKAVRDAIKEQADAEQRLKTIKEAVAQFDRAQKASKAEAADLAKRDADAQTKALVDQADQMAKRLVMTEDELRFAKELATVAELRARGEGAAARALEDAIEARRGMDADKTAEAAQRAEDDRLQSIIDQADARERYLSLSEDDKQIASDLAIIEDLRRRGENERADRLEKAVRDRQASQKQDKQAQEDRNEALRDEADILAAQRDLIADKYDRERQAAVDRARLAIKGGANAESVGKVLALELEGIERDRLKTKDQINRAAERELELARASNDVERERVRAQQEYLDNLDKGVDKKIADALLSQRLADIDKRAAEEKQQDEERLAQRVERRTGRPAGAPERGVFGAFSSLGAEAMTRREREARERKMAGLAPVARMWNGMTVEEWNAQRASKKAAAQPAAQAAEQPAVQQQAAKVQAAVEKAAQKIPDLSTLPDPTPFIEKAGAELAKVPAAFESFTKASETYAQRTVEAVERVGNAASAAVERVASSVRELTARVRRVEDRLAAAGKGGA